MGQIQQQSKRRRHSPQRKKNEEQETCKRIARQSFRQRAAECPACTWRQTTRFCPADRSEKSAQTKILRLRRRWSHWTRQGRHSPTTLVKRVKLWGKIGGFTMSKVHGGKKKQKRALISQNYGNENSNLFQRGVGVDAACFLETRELRT